MSWRAEILFLAHRIPYPPDKGDKIRSWNLLRHFSGRYRVHLAAFVDDPVDFAHESFLKGVCETVYLEPLHPWRARLRSLGGFVGGGPLSFAYFRSAAMARQVAKIRARALAFEFAYSSSMAPYIENRRGGRPRVIDLCDADSEKWRDYAKAGRGPMKYVYRREATALAVEEAQIIGWADAAFAISEAEARLLDVRSGARNLFVIGNGVDTDYFSPTAERTSPDGAADVVFVGAMDYAANIDAARWFAGDVWPSIRAAAPAARFAIIGPRPSPAIESLHGRNGIIVTDRVDDVRPWLQHARVVIAPLRIARGAPNKVLEAMAMARPVVATSAANAGIGAAPGGEILVADGALEFANAVVGVLNDASRRKTIGDGARARILADFGWSAQLGKLDTALKALGLD
jgi:sugar transferase (PEP-CTERM/EpsH1 system associated)